MSSSTGCISALLQKLPGTSTTSLVAWLGLDPDMRPVIGPNTYSRGLVFTPPDRNQPLLVPSSQSKQPSPNVAKATSRRLPSFFALVF